MAPEVREERKFNEKSDIWSLAITTNTLFGVWKGDDRTATKEKLRLIPLLMQTLLHKMFERNPENRTSTRAIIKVGFTKFFFFFFFLYQINNFF